MTSSIYNYRGRGTNGRALDGKKEISEEGRNIKRDRSIFRVERKRETCVKRDSIHDAIGDILACTYLEE